MQTGVPENNLTIFTASGEVISTDVVNPESLKTSELQGLCNEVLSSKNLVEDRISKIVINFADGNSGVVEYNEKGQWTFSTKKN